MINIESISHRYPTTKKTNKKNKLTSLGARELALNEVSFVINQGEIFGVLGPNGSGKTTLFKILSTLMKPTSGDVNLFANILSSNPAGVRSCLGVVFQQPSLDIRLSAYENLYTQGQMYGLSGEPSKNELMNY